MLSAYSSVDECRTAARAYTQVTWCCVVAHDKQEFDFVVVTVTDPVDISARLTHSGRSGERRQQC
jgi:hypothetical protein